MHDTNFFLIDPFIARGVQFEGEDAMMMPERSGDLVHGLIPRTYDIFSVIEDNVDELGSPKAQILSLTWTRERPFC